MTSATSASTHAAGADASVASVVDEEAQSTQSLTRVGEQIISSGMYTGGSASAMPLAASAPSTGGGPPGGGGGSPPVLGSMVPPPVASPSTSAPSVTPGTGMPGTGAPAHQVAPVPSSAPTPAAVAPASTGAAAPSVGAPAPAGRGTIQMLGGPHGLGPAPQAPYSPLPLEPGQPAPPPPFPLPPHNTPLPPTPPSWANPPREETARKAKDQYKDLTKKIEQHNSWRPDPGDANAVEWYNAEAKYYNEWKAQLEGQLWCKRDIRGYYQFEGYD